jgi:murein DD-endopeptidase MepM/ murein hydrolase activator NlpD
MGISDAASTAAELEMPMSRAQDQAPPSFRSASPTNAPAASHVTMRRGVFMGMIGALFTLGTCATGSLGYILLRDEALHALSARHSSIERSYEEHISSLRRELEKVNSQRVIAEAALEARVRELWSRQAQIEKRATILSSIAQGGRSAEALEKSARTSSTIPRTPSATVAPASPHALGFAPAGAPRSSSALDALEKASPKKGSPEAAPAARQQDRPALRGALMNPAIEPLAGGNLASMVAALDQVEQMQIGLASAVGKRAQREASQLEALARQIGLSNERLARASVPSAEGGPFVPLHLDPNGSPFDRELLRHQDDVVRADRLRRILATAPLARPVSPAAEQTSSFGSRIDPFLGRPAFHTGVDFRETHGASVFSTAPGTVVGAGSNGGYGLMVEIDHGNGISTRYAHLSAILVREGQKIDAQKVIGRIGNTGRSTGPHLHYEVRIDDEPVDPSRFLRAGAALASLDETAAR